MSSCSKVEIRRCRPLLGTFVEITATGLPEIKLQGAVNSAFAAIERLHNLLSVHKPDSELSLLNQTAALHPIRISLETFAVLRRAHGLAAESGGAFDYTVAPVLARWGLLPQALRRKKAGNWRDVRLLPGRQVQFLRPLALDLGGIAKGYAVDMAIRTLRHKGVQSGAVNAGGDLKAFGDQPSIIHVRHPAQPQAIAGKLQLHNCALATSSPCFTEKLWRGNLVSHLVNPTTQSAITGTTSVSVRASHCWLADALTKAVLIAPERSQKLLAKYGAEAFVFTV
jgi:thiamine biosynthesis lipoprotein